MLFPYELSQDRNDPLRSNRNRNPIDFDWYTDLYSAHSLWICVDRNRSSAATWAQRLERFRVDSPEKIEQPPIRKIRRANFCLVSHFCTTLAPA